jgi:hypothetical protein
MCDFHLNQIHGDATQSFKETSQNFNETSRNSNNASRNSNNATTSRHYLFDPTADMLYNPWLGQKIAWPQQLQQQQQQQQRKYKMPPEFMAQHVNRKLFKSSFK